MTNPPEYSPGDEVPESDWAEQNTDADPLAQVDGSPGELPAPIAPGTREANEADLAEQEIVAYIDDEV
ncbi:MAG TPA: hypothetical protein VKB85_13955 [Propionibacteriaceae bacterium]|nr:hypothetical protein [Propionibacteriaceae bacterium]